MTDNTYTIDQARAAFLFLRGFMPSNQLAAMITGATGEERQFFIDKACEYAERIKSMPKSYETDGQGKDAIAYLHYFHPVGDWYITERDMEIKQHQAFGLASLNGNPFELGYISIIELIGSNVELDVHFEPVKLSELNIPDDQKPAIF